MLMTTPISRAQHPTCSVTTQCSSPHSILSSRYKHSSRESACDTCGQSNHAKGKGRVILATSVVCARDCAVRYEGSLALCSGINTRKSNWRCNTDDVLRSGLALPLAFNFEFEAGVKPWRVTDGCETWILSALCANSPRPSFRPHAEAPPVLGTQA